MIRWQLFLNIQRYIYCPYKNLAFVDIEEMTHKTGNYKQFHVFVNMLESAISQVGFETKSYRHSISLYVQSIIVYHRYVHNIHTLFLGRIHHQKNSLFLLPEVANY